MDIVVYVIGCSDKDGVRTYVGWTNNFKQRFARHNSGKGARSTRGREWVFLYAERCETRELAMSREWYLKRNRKLRKLLAQSILCRSDLVE